MSEPVVNIPHIRAGSVVPISLNLGHIQGLYSIYESIVKSFTKEQVESLKVKFESRQPLNSQEMNMIAISQILQIVHKSAEELDMIEMRPLADTIKASIPTS